MTLEATTRILHKPTLGPAAARQLGWIVERHRTPRGDAPHIVEWRWHARKDDGRAVDLVPGSGDLTRRECLAQLRERLQYEHAYR